MFIKICGVTRAEDAALLAETETTHIGCSMTPDSPRCVTPGQAKEIFQAAGRKIKGVLTFDRQEPETVIQLAKDAGAKIVQIFHYKEPEAQTIEAAGLKVIRVHEVPTGTNLLPTMAPEPAEKQPAMLQVAASAPGLTFPWEILGNEAPHATWISGGVRPENVCALLTHHPYGININSGLELDVGVKDPDRIALLFDTIENGM